MSGGSGGQALAELVTQAPEEEATSGGRGHGAKPARPARSLAKLCACLFGGQTQQSSVAPKLASVVPSEPHKVDVDLVSAASTQQPDPVPAAAAAVEPTPHIGQHPAPSRENIWGPNQDEPPQLGPQVGENVGRKTLVLDLDETLVHSSFRVTNHADIIITVELEGEHHRVFIRKRPGVDEFLVRVAQFYEVVVYTASMAKYANPLLDELDRCNTVAFRLFREACTRQNNGYVKDLSKLGRDLKHVIIIDNSPICYALQPENAIPIRTWRDDPFDRELLDLIPILYSLADVDDIPVVLKQIVWAPDEDEDRRG